MASSDLNNMIPLAQLRPYHRVASQISSLDGVQSYNDDTRATSEQPSVDDSNSTKDTHTINAGDDEASAHSPLTPPDESLPPKHGGKRGVWSSLDDSWTWELAGLFFSAICFVAVIIICADTKDKPLSHWRSSIAPNAMVSTLTTLSKTGILLVITSCISQIKWLYYERKPRALELLDRFDDASRGPLGAARFVVSSYTESPIAFLAASITILALAFEPMAQQVFSYDNRVVVDPTAKASIPITNVYDLTRSYGYLRMVLF